MYMPICTAVGVAGEPADGTLILSAHLCSRVRCTSSQGGHKDRAYNNGLAMVNFQVFWARGGASHLRNVSLQLVRELFFLVLAPAWNVRVQRFWKTRSGTRSEVPSVSTA